MDSNTKLSPLSLKRQKNPIWIVREINKLIPSDIVRYICLWCLILNEHKWQKAHKRASKKNLNIFSDIIRLGSNEKIDTGLEKFYLSPHSETQTPFFSMSTLCNNPKQMYLDEDIMGKDLSIIHLPRPAAESFWIEDDDIKEYYKGQRKRKTYNYLVHNKCRCYNCDIVRSAAVIHGVKFK